MVDAKARLTTFREKYAPDLDARDRAALKLLDELKVVARVSLCGVQDVEGACGVWVTVPASFSNGAKVVITSGKVYVFDVEAQQQQGRTPEPLSDLSYDPVQGKFTTKDQTPPVDVIADAVVTVLEKQVPRQLRGPRPF